MDTVLVLAERPGSAWALLTLARRLGTPVAVTLAPTAVTVDPVAVDAVHPVDAVAVADLARFGAQAIWAVDSPDADACPATVRVEAMATLAAAVKPCCILIADGHDGPEVAGRLAVRLDSGVLTGAVDLWMGPRGPIVTQRVLGGSYLAESEVIRGVTICTVRTCEIAAGEAPVTPIVRRLKVALPQGLRAARVEARTRTPDDLDMAAVLVAGGHGLGSRDGFRLTDELARALGGAACGSHTATELGWCPPHRRVDQIGRAVHPLLYLALGISGSVRHRAGMQGAQNVIAVGRDREAPIFGAADLAVVGDARDVASELLNEIDRRRDK